MTAPRKRSAPRLVFLFALLGIVSWVGLQPRPQFAAATRPIIMGTHGVAVSGHHHASDAGIQIMRKGGNAIDAGVATVLAQAVVEFDRFGIGGECPILIYLADKGKVVAINGNGNAPAAATIEWFKSRNLPQIPGDGFLAATVPAALGSLVVALDEYGTMSFADVVGPAIALADGGYPVFPTWLDNLERVVPRFRAEWPSSAKVFLVDGRAPNPGDILVQKDLARTFKRLVEAENEHKGEGRSAGLRAVYDRFYKGDIAREIVEFQNNFKVRDSNGFESAGLLTVEDLADYRARGEEPAKTTYRGVEIYKIGFWSQGPVLLQALNLLEGYDLKSLGHNSAEYIHLVAEAMKLAYADREWYYADPNYVGVPEEGLLSKEYAAERRKLISLDAPSLAMRPGNPYPFHPKQMSHAPIPETLNLRPSEGGTTGTRVADSKGNIFSATPSGGWFTSSPIIEGLGFVLGTRAQAFWLDPTKSNRLEPRKQPRTSLTPSLAVKDGKPYLAWGTPGGDIQDQVNLQVALNVIDFGMTIQEAIEAPLVQIFDFPTSFEGHASSPGTMAVESRIPVEVAAGLEAKGHKVRRVGNWSMGDATAAMVDTDRGVVFGAAGPRRDKSYALAY